jgi:hypothetical protein
VLLSFLEVRFFLGHDRLQHVVETAAVRKHEELFNVRRRHGLVKVIALHFVTDAVFQKIKLAFRFNALCNDLQAEAPSKVDDDFGDGLVLCALAVSRGQTAWPS